MLCRDTRDKDAARLLTVKAKAAGYDGWLERHVAPLTNVRPTNEPVVAVLSVSKGFRQCGFRGWHRSYLAAVRQAAAGQLSLSTP